MLSLFIYFVGVTNLLYGPCKDRHPKRRNNNVEFLLFGLDPPPQWRTKCVETLVEWVFRLVEWTCESP